MFGWSENREDGKWKRENKRDFRWKGCLVGVIFRGEKMGTRSDLIKMTFLPFYFPKINSTLTLFSFLLLCCINFSPFYGFFVWRWMLFHFFKSFFFFLALSLVSLNLFFPGFFWYSHLNFFFFPEFFFLTLNHFT